MTERNSGRLRIAMLIVLCSFLVETPLAACAEMPLDTAPKYRASASISVPDGNSFYPPGDEAVIDIPYRSALIIGAAFGIGGSLTRLLRKTGTPARHIKKLVPPVHQTGAIALPVDAAQVAWLLAETEARFRGILLKSHSPQMPICVSKCSA